MKLMICGKGGSGKSTVTALLALHYAAQGKRVVVLDTDVSNTGLNRILGTDAPPDLTGHFTGERSMREAMRNARQQGIPRGTPLLGRWTFDTIPPAYSARTGNLALVSVGKIRDARQFGKGRWTGLARQFLTGLELSANDRVIIDSDAGVEHLSRNLGEACDAIISVTDPTYESVRMATTISRMADKARTPFFIVLNKTNADSSAALRAALPDPSRIIADFRQDVSIQKAGFSGSPLPPGNPAVALVVGKMDGLCEERAVTAL
ncbi:MAG: P-loop NTPase [Methanomicrobiales archaeon]|nr:P-loop NTPase [Methanomicrobiales archaeon]